MTKKAKAYLIISYHIFVVRAAEHRFPHEISGYYSMVLRYCGPLFIGKRSPHSSPTSPINYLQNNTSFILVINNTQRRLSLRPPICGKCIVKEAGMRLSPKPGSAREGMKKDAMRGNMHIHSYHLHGVVLLRS